MSRDLLLIRERAGFTPEVGKLVSMMTYARSTTLDAASGLSVEQLDHLQDARSNSIGALLLHIAAVELSYQVGTFEGRGLSPEEESRWGAALELGERGRGEIRGRALDFYLEALLDARERTLKGFRKRDDAWLFEEKPFWGGRPANHYFMWFHVFEDELNHRGQIRWLRQRLPRPGRG